MLSLVYAAGGLPRAGTFPCPRPPKSSRGKKNGVPVDPKLAKPCSLPQGSGLQVSCCLLGQGSTYGLTRGTVRSTYSLCLDAGSLLRSQKSTFVLSPAWRGPCIWAGLQTSTKQLQPLPHHYRRGKGGTRLEKELQCNRSQPVALPSASCGHCTVCPLACLPAAQGLLPINQKVLGRHLSPGGGNQRSLPWTSREGSREPPEQDSGSADGEGKQGELVCVCVYISG